MLARIRKAVIGGVGAGIGPAAVVVAKSGTLNRETVGQALGAFIAAAAVVGWATWRVPNRTA